MKTILTILLLCSACFGQGWKSTAPLPNDPNGVKSAEPLPNDSAALSWTTGPTHLQDSEVTCKTDDKDWMHVTKCNFGKHSPEEVINWMIDQNTERDTCGSKGVQWILDKNHKILYGRRTPECPLKKKRKAGAHSEATGKPDSEKPEKK